MRDILDDLTSLSELIELNKSHQAQKGYDDDGDYVFIFQVIVSFGLTITMIFKHGL